MNNFSGKWQRELAVLEKPLYFAARSTTQMIRFISFIDNFDCVEQ